MNFEDNIEFIIFKINYLTESSCLALLNISVYLALNESHNFIQKQVAKITFDWEVSNFQRPCLDSHQHPQS